MRPVVVIKCGGSIISELSDSFFSSIHSLKNSGWNVVLVHGGGPDITNTLKQMKIQTEFKNGQRKTTKEVLHVVQMTLAGKLNKQLAGECQRRGLSAVGLSGQDAGLLTARILDEELLGLVGGIEKVNTDVLELLLNQNYIPVIAPLGVTEAFETLNVNADTAAAAIAQALNADKLLFVTDVDGILNKGELICETDPAEIEGCIKSGIISGGMIPKAEAAVNSLSGTLKEVMIVNGKKAFLKDNEFFGTKICPNKEAAAG
ncbi:acetylglutamate kinase [Metabacillus sp. FJAT-52054]|uniref:Acetylglutamate kinase n=1 Tax=Metabacillus sediminis TaxID=3117746 RepID=A0ABZ2NJY9_9BACI